VYNNNGSQVKRISSPIVKTYRVDMRLVGAKKNAAIVTCDQQSYYERYGTINSGKEVTATSFKKITYKNIYPDIDWVLYIKNNKLEYDFVVHQGGNVKNIKLKYTGAKKLILKDDGVTVASMMGDIKEDKPFSYNLENGSAIASHYKLRKNVISFDIKSNEGTTVIDPQIEWSTYYGGSEGDQSWASACDVAGNVYITGITASTSNIATSGAYVSSLGGSYNAFLAKFSPSDDLLWATYMGGTLLGGDGGWNTICDHSGNIYITGQTNSSAGIATKGSFQDTYEGGPLYQEVAFLTKFNSSGSIQWGTYYGDSTGYGMAHALACDAFDNIYIGGGTSVNNRIIYSPNSYDTTFGGNEDGFIAKFRSDGKRVWGTYFGGNQNDEIRNITTDQQGNVYACGYTSSNSEIATSGAVQKTFKGLMSGFLLKLDSSSKLKWATYYGDSETLGYGVASDSFGHIYFCGEASSTTNIATTDAYQPQKGGHGDIFLAKFDTAGNRIWGTYYGGFENENPYNNPAIDGNGNILIAGSSLSTNGIASNNNNPYQKSNNGYTDACLAKFTPQGQLIWSTYFGGENYDEGMGVTYNQALGATYLTGYTMSSTNIAHGSSPYQGALAGIGSIWQGDAFIAKFNPDTTVLIKQPYYDTILCPGSTWDIAYLTSYNFNTGNTFTLQLSDSTGSFDTAKNIGSVSASGSGKISATIPPHTLLGNGYRIRITASNPLFISPDDYYNIRITDTTPTPVVFNNSPVCEGDTIKLWGNPITMSTKYFWFGTGNPYDTNLHAAIPNATITMKGDYFLNVMIPGCEPNYAETKVTINRLHPDDLTDSSNSPVITGSTLYLFAKSAFPGVTYEWTGPHSFTSNLQNPTISSVTLLARGDYYVSATYEGCKSKDSILVDVVPLSVPIKTNSNKLSLYPNPNKGNFTVKASFNSASPKEATIEVVNVVGQVVYHAVAGVQNGAIEKNVQLGTELPNGMYILRIIANDSSSILHFSINK